MVDLIAPEPGLVQKEINGLNYWFDEQTRKVHSCIGRIVPVVDKPPEPEPAPVPVDTAADTTG